MDGLFRGRRGTLLAILILAGAAFLAAALEPAQDPVSGYARASDGDSFRLGDDRVRLLGLDAPELAQQCETRTGDNWPCGRAARDALARLLAGGTVICQPDGHDQYGRILATCRVDGRDLGATLVGEGLAISSGDYGREEAAARDGRKGIWDGGFQQPRQWRDANRRPSGLVDWFWDLLP